MADEPGWIQRLSNRLRRSGRDQDQGAAPEIDWARVEALRVWREHNPPLPSVGRDQTPLDAGALRAGLLEALGEQLRSDNPDYHSLSERPDLTLTVDPPAQVDRTLLLAEAYGLYTGAVVDATDWDGRGVSVAIEQFEPNMFGQPQIVLSNDDGTYFHVGMEEVHHAPTEAELGAQLPPAAVEEFKALRRSVGQLSAPQLGTEETWSARRTAGALYTRLTGTPTGLSGRPEADNATTAPVSESAPEERSLSPAAREALDASATGERSSGALRPTNGAQPAKVWGSVPLRDLGDGRGM